MLTFIARMKVKPEKEQDYLRLVQQLSDEVRAHEPETTIYQFFRERGKPLHYAVIEQFSSEASEEAHRDTPHFHRLAPPLIDCLDGTYVREYLDPIKG